MADETSRSRIAPPTTGSGNVAYQSSGGRLEVIHRATASRPFLGQHVEHLGLLLVELAECKIVENQKIDRHCLPQHALRTLGGVGQHLRER